MTDAFGVYLKGSYARNTQKSYSDVDFVVLLSPQINIRQFMKIKARIRDRFPEWKEKELDIQHIIAENRRPPLASDIINLAYLQQNGKCEIGVDLLSQSFKVTWLDYVYCIHRDAVYRQKEIKELSVRQLLEEVGNRNSTRFLYSICFSSCLFYVLKTAESKSEQPWIFAPEQINHPLFIKVVSFMRDRFKFNIPTQESDLSQLSSMIGEILKMTQEFPVTSR